MKRSAAQFRGSRKAYRDIFQAVVAVVAAGGTTAVIDMILGSINNVAIGVALGIIYKIIVTYAQNYLETAGRIPIILPTPGIAPVVEEVKEEVVQPVIGEVGAVVETVLDEKTGDVVGQITDVVGNVADELTDHELLDLLGEGKGDLSSDLSDEPSSSDKSGQTGRNQPKRRRISRKTDPSS